MVTPLLGLIAHPQARSKVTRSGCNDDEEEEVEHGEEEEEYGEGRREGPR